MEAEELRKDFPIFGRRDVAYLDNAATSQKPEKVIEALEDFYRSKNSNVGRGLYELASEATVSYRNARKDLASFTGVSEEEIVFVRGCTEGMNLIASSLDIEGDVAVSELSHHSEQLPWREHLGEEGVKYLPVEHGVIDVEEAERIIDSGVSVVCVSHVSNVFGTEQPVDSLVDIAHDNDALVVLDAAQSVPHMPVDFRELDVDFAVFSGHKMLGPTGIGVIYGRRELLERMEPYQVGGGMVDSVKRNEIDYAPIPEKFEAGTPNIAGAVGLSAAVDYLEDVGMPEIESHDRDLAQKMIEGLSDIEGVEVHSPEGATVVSFSCGFAHPHDVAEILNQNGVAVRAGHHCAQTLMEKLGVSGTVRASPYLYNTEEDVERLVEAVREARQVFK